MPDDTAIRVLRQRSIGSSRPVLTPLAGRAAARSLYLHIPFCAHKCHYCDFYSIVDRADRQGAFTERLAAELRAQAPLAGPIETIFVGGGTPTLLAPELWQTLLATLRDHYDLGALAEFTVEANPETVTPELMDVLAAGAVNRVSVGAQSYDPRHLQTLERQHNPENVERAVTLARNAGIARASVDLIFAIPGQTPEDWARDLDLALSLGTEHMSCYALTYEPGTAMTARLARREFERADHDLEADLYAQTIDTLRAAGMHRYEVSNHARPGAECLHNLAYWRQRDWLAAGPSASGHVLGHRWKNAPRLDEYLEHPDDGFAPIVDHEPPDARRDLAERLMLGVRLSEGLDAPDILERARTLDPGAPERLRAEAARAERLEWMTLTDARWQLTESGFFFADRVAAELMGCLEPAG